MHQLNLYTVRHHEIYAFVPDSSLTIVDQKAHLTVDFENIPLRPSNLFAILLLKNHSYQNKLRQYLESEFFFYIHEVYPRSYFLQILRQCTSREVRVLKGGKVLSYSPL